VNLLFSHTHRQTHPHIHSLTHTEIHTQIHMHTQTHAHKHTHKHAYTQLAPMSSTTDVNIAVSYGDSSESLIFKIVTSNSLQVDHNLLYKSCIFKSKSKFKSINHASFKSINHASFKSISHACTTNPQSFSINESLIFKIVTSNSLQVDHKSFKGFQIHKSYRHYQKSFFEIYKSYIHYPTSLFVN
jgi:hypothetical protein